MFRQCQHLRLDNQPQKVVAWHQCILKTVTDTWQCHCLRPDAKPHQVVAWHQCILKTVTDTWHCHCLRPDAKPHQVVAWWHCILYHDYQTQPGNTCGYCILNCLSSGLEPWLPNTAGQHLWLLHSELFIVKSWTMITKHQCCAYCILFSNCLV